MSDSVKEFLTVLANDDLEPGVKLGLITTASAHMIEEALCGIGRHDDRIMTRSPRICERISDGAAPSITTGYFTEEVAWPI